MTQNSIYISKCFGRFLGKNKLKLGKTKVFFGRIKPSDKLVFIKTHITFDITKGLILNGQHWTYKSNIYLVPKFELHPLVGSIPSRAKFCTHLHSSTSSGFLFASNSTYFILSRPKPYKNQIKEERLLNTYFDLIKDSKHKL